MKKFGTIAALALALPFVAGAQNVTNSVSNLQNIISFIKSLINTALPLIIALAVVVFVWGMFQVILSGDDEEKKAKAKSTVMYGVIAIFVMVSIWGLVNILYNSFGLDRQNRGAEVQNQLPQNF